MNIKHSNQTKHNYQTKTKLSPQGPQWSRHSVARVRRRSENIHPQNLSNVSMWQIWGDKEFFSFICVKHEWESPHSILVIRNP
jgi:hypothetical protein